MAGLGAVLGDGTQLYANRSHCRFVSNNERSGVYTDTAYGPGRQAAKQESFIFPQDDSQEIPFEMLVQEKMMGGRGDCLHLLHLPTHTYRATTVLVPKP